jgi:hypothetical protein
VVEIVPALAANVTLVDPAGTVTEAAGTGNNVSLLDMDTAVPPVGATPLNATVQVVAAPELKLVGLHVNEDKVGGGGVRLMEAVFETLLRVAVNVAV